MNIKLTHLLNCISNLWHLCYRIMSILYCMHYQIRAYWKGGPFKKPIQLYHISLPSAQSSVQVSYEAGRKLKRKHGEMCMDYLEKDV